METANQLPAKSWSSSTLTSEKLRNLYDRWPGIIAFFLFYAVPPTVVLCMILIARNSNLNTEELKKRTEQIYSIAQGLLPPFFAIMFCYAAFFRKWSLKKVGLRRFTKLQAYRVGLFTVACVLFVVALHAFLEKHIAPVGETSVFFKSYYIFLSCGMQTILYSSFVHAEWKVRGYGKKSFIIISSLNFMYLHIFYVAPLTLILTFLVGIAWAWFYWKYRNFWLCAFSHVVLGFLTILLNLI